MHNNINMQSMMIILADYLYYNYVPASRITQCFIYRATHSGKMLFKITVSSVLDEEQGLHSSRYLVTCVLTFLTIEVKAQLL